MSSTEKEVARLLEVREEEEKEKQEEQTFEEVLEENGAELVSKTSQATLEPVEILQLENISLQQALASEKLVAARQRLEMLTSNIKIRLQAPPEAQLAFDPQNPNIVRIVIPNDEGRT